MFTCVRGLLTFLDLHFPRKTRVVLTDIFCNAINVHKLDNRVLFDSRSRDLKEMLRLEQMSKKIIDSGKKSLSSSNVLKKSWNGLDVFICKLCPYEQLFILKGKYTIDLLNVLKFLGSWNISSYDRTKNSKFVGSIKPSILVVFLKSMYFCLFCALLSFSFCPSNQTDWVLLKVQVLYFVLNLFFFFYQIFLHEYVIFTQSFDQNQSFTSHQAHSWTMSRVKDLLELNEEFVINTQVYL